MHSDKCETNTASKRLNLSAEELYEQFRMGKIPQRHRKFLLRALEESGCKVLIKQKKCVQKNRGKEAFKPTDMPKLFSSIENLTCMMASLVSSVTGARREETSEILKENIDFNECRIRLIITKKGVPQDVFFPKSFTPILQKWIHYAQNSKYLFPQRYASDKPISITTLSKELDQATTKAGLKQAMYVKENGHRISRYGFHSFRKFFCSMLVNSGVTMETARKLMRHEKMELTASVYAHLGRRNLTDAIQKIDPYCEPQQQNQDSNNPAQTTLPQHQPNTQEMFTTQYIQLFNEYRNGRINEQEYHKQKQELTQIQTLMKS